MNLILIFAAIVALAILAAVAVRAIGGNIALVSDWKQSWRYYSSYAMLLVAMLPDLWNALLAGGYLDASDVPSEFSWSVKIGLALTFILKQIRQVERPELPDFGNSKS